MASTNPELFPILSCKRPQQAAMRTRLDAAFALLFKGQRHAS